MRSSSPPQRSLVGWKHARPPSHCGKVVQIALYHDAKRIDTASMCLNSDILKYLSSVWPLKMFDSPAPQKKPSPLSSLIFSCACLSLPKACITDLPKNFRCRQVKALLLLDITQTLGAMPFDGASIRPDAAAFSVHKWLHGPHGVSMLYVADSLQGIVKPLVHHDRNRAGSTDPRYPLCPLNCLILVFLAF